MSLNANELRAVVTNVWTTSFGADVQPAQPEAATCTPAVAATIFFTGAWCGSIELVCGWSLAQRLASTMFGTGDQPLASRDVHDAVGELANMIAGNAKGLLPSPSYLSLPCVVSGGEASVSEREAPSLLEAFECLGKRFVVIVRENAPAASRPPSVFPRSP